MEQAWYAKKATEVLLHFGSNEEGLSSDEQKIRLDKYGLNKLPEAKSDSPVLIFLRQFQSPLIYILFAASFIVLLLGEVVDSSIILFVLLFNAIIGTIQEGKAQNTLLALKKFTETNTKVLRQGKELVVPDYEIVPGDIIVLQEGDKIPADSRIILSGNLTVDESALTGESIPVHKISDPIASLNLQTGDQKNMVFKGTHIVAGNGRAVVVATGLGTIIGKISGEIALINTEIPLKTNIRYLTRLIIAAVFIISTLIFVLGIISGHTAREMFAVVVSLSVSIIPEGLPIVMTLVLATGVFRMSKRNALIKKLQAVEALGQAQVLALDKTGTLTKNEIVLQKIYTNGKTFTASEKEGITLNNQIIDPLNHPELLRSAKMAAFIAQNTNDPTDLSLFAFAKKLGFHQTVLEKESPKISELPFDYKTKYHAILHKAEAGNNLTVLGAPEKILEISSLTKEKRKKLEDVLTGMFQEGLRVVAFAYKNKAGGSIKPEDIKDLTFAGFFGLKDTLRPEVHEAMAKAVSAGIKVVMMTGDHKITACAIAKEAGIFHEGDTVLTGEDIDSLSEEEFADTLYNVSVFARVTPDHKLKIVSAYKKKGQIIAMTGDGVNDAPSLVAADLGVSMGKIGTEVAKEASDIVLLDDNFGSIISAVEEGRSIYKTIKKVLLYLFSTGWGEVFVITGALLLGMPLPILAAQIVWLNFVTDGFLDVSLSMEPKEEGLLKKSFEHPKKYLLDAVTIQRIFILAIPMMVGTLFLFQKYYQADLVKAQTVALTTLAVFQWFNAWNCRHETKSVFAMNPFSNKYLVGATFIVIILQFLAIYNPLLQKILKTKPLDLSDWLIIIPVASSVIVVEETRKIIQRKLASYSISKTKPPQVKSFAPSPSPV